MKYDYLIIGGGIAGLTAAETIRKNDAGSIAIVGEELHLPYSRVLLPHYLKGKIDREKLFLRTKEDLREKKIDLILGKKAIALDPEKKEIEILGGEKISYEKLIIATGGRVKKWESNGSDKKNIFYLQTIDNADAIKEAMPNIKKAVVIGGGFIALEFLEIFSSLGIDTTLICRGSYFFSRVLGEDGGDLLARNFSRHGINAIFSEEVREVTGEGEVSGVITKSGQKLDCDAIGLGIGLEMNGSFSKSNGLKTDEGILTDQYLTAGNKDILVAGDVAQFFDPVFGRERVVGNWTNAFLQGQAAGLNALGKKTEFKPVTSYSIANLGFNIIFIGETKNSSESLSRIDEAKEKYERIFLLGGRVVGAALINMPEDRKKIISLIENRAAIKNFNNLDEA